MKWLCRYLYGLSARSALAPPTSTNLVRFPRENSHDDGPSANRKMRLVYRVGHSPHVRWRAVRPSLLSAVAVATSWQYLHTLHRSKSSSNETKITEVTYSLSIVEHRSTYRPFVRSHRLGTAGGSARLSQAPSFDVILRGNCTMMHSLTYIRFRCVFG